MSSTALTEYHSVHHTTNDDPCHDGYICSVHPMHLISRPPRQFQGMFSMLYMTVITVILGVPIIVYKYHNIHYFYALFIAVFAAKLFVYYSFNNLAAEIVDNGDALIVRKSDNNATIPLADIAAMNIRRSRLGGYSIIAVLVLHTPCCFGSKIKFLPLPLGGSNGFRKFIEAGTGGTWVPDYATFKGLNARIDQCMPATLASSSNSRSS